MMNSLLTVQQVAARLECNPETIRRAVRVGALGCHRLGNRYRISVDQLDAFLEARRCPGPGLIAPTSNDTEENMQSHGMRKAPAAGFRQEQRMKNALDNSSRISKASLSVIRSN